MKRSGASIKGLIVTGLLILLISVCVAAGIMFAAPFKALAEEGQTTETPIEGDADGEDNPSADTGVELTKDNINLTLGSASVEYTGEANNLPEIIVTYNNTPLVKDTDYTVSSERVNVGKADIVINGVGNYKGELTYTAAYEIVKARNYWVETPNILSWTWGSYGRVTGDSETLPEFINAKPAFGAEEMFFIISRAIGNYIGVGQPVYFTNVTKNEYGETITQSNYRFSFDAEGNLPEYVAEGLKDLDAGKYFLFASVPGDKAGNYSELNSMTNADRVRFEVSPLTNYWEASPNIVQWSWGGFSRTHNKINAKPKYTLEGRYVNFGIYNDADCLETSLVSSRLFEVEGGGMIENDTELISSIADLEAGTYFLCASYYGDGNISELRTVIQFYVTKVQNHWETTPNIVQWKWDEYDAEVNTITAVPAHGNIEDVVYGIYTANGRAVSKELESFSYIKTLEPIIKDDGSFGGNTLTYAFDAIVAKQIEMLDAGTYYLRVTLPDTKNYTGLSGASIEFSVQDVQNHWTETPALLSWKYGEYDTKVNKITGAAAYGGEVVFTIYDKDVEKVLFSKDGKIADSFTLERGDVPEYVSNRLKALGVGTYYMLATVEGDGNFTGLNTYTEAEDIKNYGIEFEVTTATNSWKTLPRVLGWSEGNFDAEINSIVAEAMNGNDGMIIRVYDEKNNLITSNEGGKELDYTAISQLAIGSYRVTFEVAGTNNYTALNGEITFAVSEDSVALTGIITAAVIFAVFDIVAAGVCVILVIRRRKKVEQGYREMIRKELNGR